MSVKVICCLINTIVQVHTHSNTSTFVGEYCLRRSRQKDLSFVYSKSSNRVSVVCRDDGVAVTLH